MRMTLIEMVQNILSSMDSDEVNSIGDTVEALQVAEVIRETYNDLVANNHIPTNEGLLKLEPLNDPDRPVYLRLPDNVRNIKWVKYQRADGTFYDVNYLCPEEFLRHIGQYDRLSGTVVSVKDHGGVSLVYKAYEEPTYWTTFDNEHLVFNSYNLDVESTLMGSKTMCWGTKIPDFDLSDNFVPHMDINLFPMLLAEAKATCFVNFKQTSNTNEDRKARRHLIRSQSESYRANQRRPYEQATNYGRPGRRQAYRRSRY